ncbi:MAG: hypothetical protein RL308_2737 [Bacteroidota bacterium]|jgi:hypothetical protein
MKTKIIYFAFIAFLFANQVIAQNKTTVSANNSEISDNLDLKAVASIFGDSKNLEDFERRLNDPNLKISNLDLNYDNQVDYLRVIESVEGRTHLIIIQAVLEKDVFQDIATIEVEKDKNNRLQIQVVGDVFMYGNNYIYEPIYVHSPLFFTSFWVISYRPYYSTWNWGYYPNYYHYWRPLPIYRYRRNVYSHINHNYRYNYVNVRRSNVAINLHRNLRANSFESRNPDRSFERRNSNVSNRYELERSRTSNTRSNSVTPRGNDRSPNATPRGNRTETVTPRGNERSPNETPRGNRNETVTPRVNESSPNATPRGNRTETVTPRGNERTPNETPRGNRNENVTPRGNSNSSNSERSSTPRNESRRENR